MKKIICTLLFATVISGGCSSTQVSDDVFVTYKVKKHGYSIDFPESWSVEKYESGLMSILGSSPAENREDMFTENVGVAIEPLTGANAYMALDEYFELSIKGMENALDDYQLIKQSKTKVDGREAYVVVQTYEFGSVKIKSLMYILVINQTGYVLAFTASPQTFNRYLDIFQAIVDRFRFY
ncbi:MAG: PsbP-related protein [Leptospirales bacterium]